MAVQFTIWILWGCTWAGEIFLILFKLAAAFSGEEWSSDSEEVNILCSSQVWALVTQ